jgi:lipid-A-disaccharide synthase
MLSVAASGTVTLEAALYGMPMVIIYKVSPLSYWIGRALIRGVDHIGLANLVAGHGVVPELIQQDANAKKISETVLSMLSDGDRLEGIKRQLLNIRHRLGPPGASKRAADIALSMI